MSVAGPGWFSCPDDLSWRVFSPHSAVDPFVESSFRTISASVLNMEGQCRLHKRWEGRVRATVPSAMQRDR